MLFVVSKRKMKNIVSLNAAPGGSSASAAWDGNRQKVKRRNGISNALKAELCKAEPLRQAYSTTETQPLTKTSNLTLTLKQKSTILTCKTKSRTVK